MIPFIWSGYSQTVHNALLKACHVGQIEHPKGRRVEGHVEGQVHLFLDIDESMGRIQGAHFRLFGPTLLFVACEGLCSLIIGKTIAQASRISVSLLARELDFPSEGKGFIEIALAALFDALELCADITAGVISPIHVSQEGELPDFDALSESERLNLIEAVLDDKVRPYIELDSGAVVVKELKGNRLTITYEGACTTCPAAIGGTLQSITEVLRMSVSPDIVVEPDMEGLSHFV